MPRPHVIRVEFDGDVADLIHFRFGAASRADSKVLVMSGVHGSEHAGIQTSYELAQRLSESQLAGQVDVLPVCNPMAFAAESRFTPPTDRDMSRAFGRQPPTDLVGALARAVLDLALGASVVLNLHSAGDARYLPHAIYYRRRDADWAADLGLPFIIQRAALEALPGHIATRLGSAQRTVTLEVGGGLAACRQDIDLGLRAIMDLLRRMGILRTAEGGLSPTELANRYDHDARCFVRAPDDGAFYPLSEVGVDAREGEPFGTWVPLRGLVPRAVLVPITGLLVYQRTRHRAPAGATLAMFLPKQDT